MSYAGEVQIANAITFLAKCIRDRSMTPVARPCGCLVQGSVSETCEKCV